MAAAKVDGYSLSWSIAANKGAVYIHTIDGKQGQINVDSAVELAALGDILRNSQDVGFDPNGQVLTTARRPPGVA